MSTSRLRCVPVGAVLAWALLLASALPASANGLPPTCVDELRAALPGAGAGDAVVAVELLARAMTLAEPAYPSLRGGGGPIAAGEPGADAARYLHRRRMLPDGWSVATHDDEAWRAMLARFARAYRATEPEVRGGGRDRMLDDAVRTLSAVSEALRPLAVFATDDDDVTFFAVIWNWTPVPRLIIVRPRDGLALGAGADSSTRAAPVLEAMSTCAVLFESFVYASEEIALRMFVQQGESIMRILASEPERGGWPDVVAADRVVDAFRFDDPTLDGLDAIAVSIEGPSIGVGTAITVLAAVRTNLGLDGLFHFLAFP